MQAGYDEQQALDLAIRTNVDLHQAVELLEQGCPPDLAAEILR